MTRVQYDDTPFPYVDEEYLVEWEGDNSETFESLGDALNYAVDLELSGKATVVSLITTYYDGFGDVTHTTKERIELEEGEDLEV